MKDQRKSMQCAYPRAVAVVVVDDDDADDDKVDGGRGGLAKCCVSLSFASNEIIHNSQLFWMKK